MELLTVKEAALRLGLSEVTIRRYIKNGDLKAVIVGKRGVRIPKSEIERMSCREYDPKKDKALSESLPPRSELKQGPSGRKPSLPPFYHRQAEVSTGLA
jgi:excisionase family DNA binding protein